LLTVFTINLYCLGKNTGIQYARLVKADLAMLIATDLIIIEIFTYDALFEHSRFVQVDWFILFTANAIDSKIIFENACFHCAIRMKSIFRTGFANRLINTPTCSCIGYEYDAQHNNSVLHGNLLL
jgi:hypothetical protein